MRSQLHFALFALASFFTIAAQARAEDQVYSPSIEIEQVDSSLVEGWRFGVLLSYGPDFDAAFKYVNEAGEEKRIPIRINVSGLGFTLGGHFTFSSQISFKLESNPGLLVSDYFSEFSGARTGFNLDLGPIHELELFGESAKLSNGKGVKLVYDAGTSGLLIDASVMWVNLVRQ